MNCLKERYNHPQKNTLLKNAEANAEGNFFKRVFFSPTQEKLFFKISFPSKKFKTQTHSHDRTATRLDKDCKKYTVDTDTKDRTTGHNSTYPKGGVSCSKDSFAGNGSLVFQIKFCGKSPALRVAANRWQPYF